MNCVEVSINQKISLTYDEASALSGLSKSTLFNLMKTGLLPYSKVSKRRLILRKDLEDFLLRSRQFDANQTAI